MDIAAITAKFVPRLIETAQQERLDKAMGDSNVLVAEIKKSSLGGEFKRLVDENSANLSIAYGSKKVIPLLVESLINECASLAQRLKDYQQVEWKVQQATMGGREHVKAIEARTAMSTAAEKGDLNKMDQIYKKYIQEAQQGKQAVGSLLDDLIK